jgi:hypothetical protein
MRRAALLSSLAVVLGAACAGSGGSGGADASSDANPGDGATPDTRREGDAATQDTGAQGDDGGGGRDVVEDLADGPLCPPCNPKEICCAATGMCYPAGCLSCCM